jgi:lysophospholipase L1-like esterase
VEAADNLEAIVARGRRLGLQVYLANVLPWNNGPAGAAGSIADLNRRIDHVGADAGVPVIDFNAALADPRDPTAMAPRLTADGDHPSVEGYRRLGELVARKLEGLAER